MTAKPKEFINCHTHTFTGDHVPRYLGKKMLPLGIGYLLTIPLIVNFFRWYENGPKRWRFQKWYKFWLEIKFKIKLFSKKISLILFPISSLLTLDAILILFLKIFRKICPEPIGGDRLSSFVHFLEKWYLLPTSSQIFLRVLIVLTVFILIKSGRKIIFFLLRLLYRFLGFFPGPHTTAYFKRYLSIGMFAFHKNQISIFKDMVNEYPQDTRFVVLPMDMDYMAAGTPIRNYMLQLSELREMKLHYSKNCLPFIFADPRRIKEDATYIDLIKKCIVEEDFRGIKIYPALGYYPFDEHLLELMLWACENEIPVLNHCISGVIYYRGDKLSEWFEHPIFRQSTGETGESEPLKLYELNNRLFMNQFTHPLNYLGLLDETYLRKLIIKYDNAELNLLFGYTNANTPLLKDLSKLKICFGHFGGEDEWMKFLESDRYIYNNCFNNRPLTGIDFNPPGGIENIWNFVSWFSIIYSYMIQYPNVYADISYTLHDERIYTLLKSLLNVESGISDKILFGTDFYVVRSQKSDKQMWIDIEGNLEPEQFDLITNANPCKFLKNNINGNVY